MGRNMAGSRIPSLWSSACILRGCSIILFFYFKTVSWNLQVMLTSLTSCRTSRVPSPSRHQISRHACLELLFWQVQCLPPLQQWIEYFKRDLVDGNYLKRWVNQCNATTIPDASTWRCSSVPCPKRSPFSLTKGYSDGWCINTCNLELLDDIS